MGELYTLWIGFLSSLIFSFPTDCRPTVILEILYPVIEVEANCAILNQAHTIFSYLSQAVCVHSILFAGTRLTDSEGKSNSNEEVESSQITEMDRKMRCLQYNTTPLCFYIASISI